MTIRHERQEHVEGARVLNEPKRPGRPNPNRTAIRQDGLPERVRVVVPGDGNTQVREESLLPRFLAVKHELDVEECVNRGY